MTDEKDVDDLWALYGNIGNKRVQPLRSICRERLQGIDPFLVVVNLERSASEARQIAVKIRWNDGKDEAADKADRIADVFDYWADRPLDLRALVKEMYRKEYEESAADTSVADYEGGIKCPYEESPEARSCWSCHAPIKVFNEMALQYDRENED